jgi:hypothetical protein
MDGDDKGLRFGMVADIVGDWNDTGVPITGESTCDGVLLIVGTIVDEPGTATIGVVAGVAPGEANGVTLAGVDTGLPITGVFTWDGIIAFVGALGDEPGIATGVTTGVVAVVAPGEGKVAGVPGLIGTGLPFIGDLTGVGVTAFIGNMVDEPGAVTGEAAGVVPGATAGGDKGVTLVGLSGLIVEGETGVTAGKLDGADVDDTDKFGGELLVELSTGDTDGDTAGSVLIGDTGGTLIGVAIGASTGVSVCADNGLLLGTRLNKPSGVDDGYVLGTVLWLAEGIEVGMAPVEFVGVDTGQVAGGKLEISHIPLLINNSKPLTRE